jgi:hypothetical protein
MEVLNQRTYLAGPTFQFIALKALERGHWKKLKMRIDQVDERGFAQQFQKHNIDIVRSPTHETSLTWSL